MDPTPAAARSPVTCSGALRAGEVFPVFQPLCRAADRVVVGAEALARWRHPDLGPVPPDEFIAIAEQTGLIGELTSVVLDKAAAPGAGVAGPGARPARVGQPLAPVADRGGPAGRRSQAALASARPAAVGAAAGDHRVDHHEQRRAGLRVLGALRDAGVHTALDDFGTGHSSLTQLRAIPVDEVKLDRSFLAGVDVGRGRTQGRRHGGRPLPRPGEDGRRRRGGGRADGELPARQRCRPAAGLLPRASAAGGRLVERTAAAPCDARRPSSVHRAGSGSAGAPRAPARRRRRLGSRSSCCHVAAPCSVRGGRVVCGSRSSCWPCGCSFGWRGGRGGGAGLDPAAAHVAVLSGSGLRVGDPV